MAVEFLVAVCFVSVQVSWREVRGFKVNTTFRRHQKIQKPVLVRVWKAYHCDYKKNFFGGFLKTTSACPMYMIHTFV
jgi:hypothetical protein